MSTINRSKRLAEKARQQQAAESRKAIKCAHDLKRTAAAERRLIFQTVKKLEKEAPKMFRVTQNTGIFGEVATIYKLAEEKGLEDERIGTVCLQTESYMWRGSDESPEQGMKDTHLRLLNIVNAGGSLVEVTLSDKIRKVALRDALDQFEEALAVYLAKYF